MLKPLNKINEVMSDADLTSGEAHLLTVMVLKADNQTGRVRQSQATIAAYAGVNERTLRRALTSPAVLKYFSSIEKTGRWVNLTLHTDTGQIVRNARSWDAEDKVVKVRPTGHFVHDTGHFVHDTGHSVQPSALSSALSSDKKDDTSVATLPRVETVEFNLQGDVDETAQTPLDSIEPAPLADDALTTGDDNTPDKMSAIEIEEEDLTIKEQLLIMIRDRNHFTAYYMIRQIEAGYVEANPGLTVTELFEALRHQEKEDW